MKSKILLFIFISSLLLSACNSAKDALQGKTRSERSDEFLVEKKNPLSMPPDYDKLPKPMDDSNESTSLDKKKDLKAKLKIKSDKVMIDGKSFKAKKKIDFECIVGGDDKYISIAAASILAKVKRDEIMCKLSAQFPMYDWEKNKGYGTVKHKEMIYKYGRCEYHRMTFNIKNKQLKLTI